MQIYVCKVCSHCFDSGRRTRISLIRKLWKSYIFGKQTIKQLSVEFGLDRRQVREYLNSYSAPDKIHNPRPIHLIVDATYFGERKEGRSWCVIDARDPVKKENLIWSFEDTETTSGYLYIREALEALGYTILSVTADGFSGIKTAFYGIPYQMCQVYMERLVIQGTTRNPQTEAGQVLLALVKTLHCTDSYTFHIRFKKYIERYQDFLNEKTVHPLTDERSWTHEDLRRAVHRLARHKRYLFIFEHNKNIPKTTNSLEGHFGHIKKLIRTHHGVNKENTQKILNTILFASTTAPNKKRLNEIL